MGLKRLIRKGVLSGGGAIVQGHIYDALKKKNESGRPFRECLEESVKETFTDDLPGTSHIYQMGKKDGKIQGTSEQAERDAEIIQKMHDKHESDRKEWQTIDKEKDSLINDLLK